MENKDTVTLEQLQNQIIELQKKVQKLENNRQDQLSMAVFLGEKEKNFAAMIIFFAAAAMDIQRKIFFSYAFNDAAFTGIFKSLKEIKNCCPIQTSVYLFA